MLSLIQKECSSNPEVLLVSTNTTTMFPTVVQMHCIFLKKIVTGEWKPLPVLTPEQLIKARKVKHIFTGNLDADIITNPPYKWKERHLVL